MLLVAGCAASGRIGTLPPVPDPASAGTVTVIRPSHLVSAANAFTIAVNGADLLAINAGERATFRLPAGPARVSVKCFGGWSPTWKESATAVTVPAGGTVYLRVAPDMSCAGIAPVPATDAPALLDGTSEIDLASTSR